MTAIIQRCLDCYSRLFPLRLLCPSCGGSSLSQTTVESGIIEQLTTLADGTVLAIIRANGGPPLIARLTGSGGVGDPAPLTNDSRAGLGHAYVPFTPPPHESSWEEK